MAMGRKSTEDALLVAYKSSYSTWNSAQVSKYNCVHSEAYSLCEYLSPKQSRLCKQKTLPGISTTVNTAQYEVIKRRYMYNACCMHYIVYWLYSVLTHEQTHPSHDDIAITIIIINRRHLEDDLANR